MRHAHPLEICAMLGRRRSDQLAAVIALEIERNGQPPAVEPHERLIVSRDDGGVWQILHDRKQLSEVGRDGARLRIPPSAAEALKLVVEVTAGDHSAQ